MRRDEERELRLCAWDDETELTNPVSQSWCIGVQVTLSWHGEDKRRQLRSPVRSESRFLVALASSRSASQTNILSEKERGRCYRCFSQFRVILQRCSFN